MTLDQKQQAALFRYSVIAPLETGASDPSISNNEFFRRAAQKTYTGPDGKETTMDASTIEKWHRAYQHGGFQALFPQSRSDEGISRKLTPEIQAQIRFLLREHPRITAAEIHRILLSGGSICLGQFSVSTVERFVRHVRKKEGTAPAKTCGGMNARISMKYGMVTPVTARIFPPRRGKSVCISSH